LLGSLLDVAGRNRARGASTVRLFEAGAVYLPEDGALPREPYRVGALLLGPARPATWRDAAPRPADFYVAKGVLGGLLDALRVPWTVERATEPFLHPGRAARIALDGEDAGWLGEIHPLVAHEWGLEETVAGFELDLDVAAAHVPDALLYEDLTSFPAVREDLAVIVADTVSAAQVLDVVREAGGKLVAGAEVFDVYRDEPLLGAGNVSIAVRLRFRAPDRTLTDEEVATRRRKIAAALTSQLQGRVRDS
jgi:phenylalanyl-tRNA synthetase beta chain